MPVMFDGGEERERGTEEREEERLELS